MAGKTQYQRAINRFTHLVLSATTLEQARARMEVIVDTVSEQTYIDLQNRVENAMGHDFGWGNTHAGVFAVSDARPNIDEILAEEEKKP